MIHEDLNRVHSYTRLARVFDKDYIQKKHKQTELFDSGNYSKLINETNVTKKVKPSIGCFRKKPIGLTKVYSNIIINDNNNKLNDFYYKKRSLNTNFVNHFKKAIVYNKDIIPNYLKCIKHINVSLNSQTTLNSTKNIFPTLDFGLSNENTTIDFDENVKTVKFKSFTKSPQNRIKLTKCINKTETIQKDIDLDNEVIKTKLKTNNSNENNENNDNVQMCPKLSSSNKEQNERDLEQKRKQLIQSKMQIYESKLFLLFR